MIPAHLATPVELDLGYLHHISLLHSPTLFISGAFLPVGHLDIRLSRHKFYPPSGHIYTTKLDVVKGKMGNIVRHEVFCM